jgi:DNA adenine methylase
LGELQTKEQILRPFLRWVGGKQRLIYSLLDFVPTVKFKKYYEPFFGAGSMFFALKPENAILSDVNEELILCYKQVARYPNEIYKYLKKYESNNNSVFYYKIRGENLSLLSLKERAARFIYLNKAAFNGIYRVNKDGLFNVPFGGQNGLSLPTEKVLQNSARCLRKAEIIYGDFEKIVSKARKNDFIYFDPPYPPRSDTAFFNHYSKDRFGWEEQIRLSKVFKKLSQKGCFVMLSNADRKIVTNLYEGYNKYRLNTKRWLGSNGDRFPVREIIVTNY